MTKQILVLGPGCFRCQKQHEYALAAAEEVDVDCEVTKVTDISAIAGYGVMQTPAVIIDGDLKASGKILTVDEIKKILAE
jgi:small redox-active disulfide protein 2